MVYQNVGTVLYIVIFEGNFFNLPGMYVRNNFLILFLLMCLWYADTQAQDTGFSMMFEERMYYNPAFAGLEQGRASLGFRDLYPGSDATFITMAASWDQPVTFLHGGYGVMLMHDRSAGGMLSLSGVSLTYSYHLQISRSLFLNSGFTASLMQNYFDAGKIVLPDMISPGSGIILPPGETIGSESIFFPDFAVGFLLYGDNWLGSVAAWHLMEPYRSQVKNDQTTLKRRYTFLFSYTLSAKDELSFFPWCGGMIQGRSQQYVLGGQMNYKIVSAGLAWKKNFGNRYDAAVFSFGLLAGNMRFLYSYDAFVGRGGSHPPGGAHEAAIVVNIGKSYDRKTIIFPQL